MVSMGGCVLSGVVVMIPLVSWMAGIGILAMAIVLVGDRLDAFGVIR